MEKKIYESPVMEVIEFAAEDIIATSITPGENELPIVPADKQTRNIYTEG